MLLVASRQLPAAMADGLLLEFDQAGCVELSERPGLGVELEPETVEQYRVQ